MAPSWCVEELWAGRGKINNVASLIFANRKCGGESADVSRLDHGRHSRQKEKHPKEKTPLYKGHCSRGQSGAAKIINLKWFITTATHTIRSRCQTGSFSSLGSGRFSSRLGKMRQKWRNLVNVCRSWSCLCTWWSDWNWESSAAFGCSNWPKLHSSRKPNQATSDEWSVKEKLCRFLSAGPGAQLFWPGIRWELVCLVG